MIDEEGFKASLQIVKMVMENEIVIRAFKKTEVSYRNDPVLLELNEESFNSAVMATVEVILLNFDKIKLIVDDLDKQIMREAGGFTNAD
jgi:hypothetical protein